MDGSEVQKSWKIRVIQNLIGMSPTVSERDNSSTWRWEIKTCGISQLETRNYPQPGKTSSQTPPFYKLQTRSRNQEFPESRNPCHCSRCITANIATDIEQMAKEMPRLIRLIRLSFHFLPLPPCQGAPPESEARRINCASRRSS
jgi:hypothetical protein